MVGFHVCRRLIARSRKAGGRMEPEQLSEMEFEAQMAKGYISRYLLAL